VIVRELVRECAQVVGRRFRLVVAGECADDADAERLCGVDDLAQMRVDLFAVGRVGMEVVR